MGLCTLGVVWFAWSLWNPESGNLVEAPRDSADESNRTESHEIAEADTELASSALAGTQATTFEELTLIDSEFLRGLALYNFALNVDETEILDLIAQTKNLPPRFQYEFQRVLVQRLYEINPELALSHVEDFHTGLVQLLYQDLARRDLTGAIARAKSLEGATREAATLGLLSPQSEISAEQRSEIARELGREQLSSGLSLGQQFAEMQRNPENAWSEALREDGHDSDQLQTLMMAATVWISHSGLEVIDEIRTSLDDPQVREQVLTSALVTSTQSIDFIEVFRKARELDSTPDKRMLMVLVGSATRRAPMAVFEALDEVELPSLRRDLQLTAVHNWAYADPQALLDQLERIPEEMQSTAQGSAIQAMARNDPVGALSHARALAPSAARASLVSDIASSWAEQDPHAALAWAMSDQEYAGSRTRLLSTVITSWSSRDPNAALNWILDQRDLPEIRQDVIHAILRNLADSDPELALQRALEQPIRDDWLGLEHTVISRIAQSDLQLAREMLQHAREGQTRSNSYAAVGLAMVRASRGIEALELADNLAESDRAGYLESIFWQWASYDAGGLLDALSSISNSKIQSSAADALITRNNSTDILTDEQIEYVRQFKSEDDEEIIINRSLPQ